MAANRFSLFGDSRANKLALLVMAPSWLAGLIGSFDHDVNAVVLGMLLSLCGGIVARFIPRLFGWPPYVDLAERTQVARDATRLAFWLGLLTFVALVVFGIPAGCNGAYECPV